jgi:hypothetical protein
VDLLVRLRDGREDTVEFPMTIRSDDPDFSDLLAALPRPAESTEVELTNNMRAWLFGGNRDDRIQLDADQVAVVAGFLARAQAMGETTVSTRELRALRRQVACFDCGAVLPPGEAHWSSGYPMCKADLKRSDKRHAKLMKRLNRESEERATRSIEARETERRLGAVHRKGGFSIGSAALGFLIGRGLDRRD